MQARALVGSALLAAGMLLAGCGGTEPVQAEPEELVSREDALPNCNGQNYEFEYYSDATYTTLVGIRGCDCANYYRWGTTSAYSLNWYGTCY